MPLNVTKKLYRNIHTGKLEDLTPQRLEIFADQYEEYDQAEDECLTCGDESVHEEPTPKPTPKLVAEKKEDK